MPTDKQIRSLCFKCFLHNAEQGFQVSCCIKTVFENSTLKFNFGPSQNSNHSFDDIP